MLFLHGVSARLIYNFDEYGFQPGQGQSRKVVGSKSSYPDLAEGDRGELSPQLGVLAQMAS